MTELKDDVRDLDGNGGLNLFPEGMTPGEMLRFFHESGAATSEGTPVVYSGGESRVPRADELALSYRTPWDGITKIPGSEYNVPNIIVAVEDSPDIAFLFQRLLSKQFPGFDIELFPDAESALVFIATRDHQRHRIAAIITDVGLPGMLGTDLLHVLNGSQHFPISLPPEIAAELKGKPMFLHSDADPSHDHIKSALAKGHADAFLPKMPKPEVLTDKFRQGLLNAMRRSIPRINRRRAQ